MKLFGLAIALVGFSEVSSFGVNKLRTERSRKTSLEIFKGPKEYALVLYISFALTTNPLTVLADGQTKDFKLPPIDTSDKTRCQFSSSKMGQANAARDKLYDLRQCNLSGKIASGFDLSGVIMDKTDVSNAKFIESQLSKAYLHASKFDGADFTNAIVDRANFADSSLRGAIFKNTVLTGTTFDNADLEGADFTDAYLGDFDIRNLCRNPTLKGENSLTGVDSRISAGCAGSAN